MYKHIVMWKLKTGLNLEERAAQLEQASRMLRRLPAQIDGISHYEVGINIADYDASFSDFSLVSVFESKQAFDAYCTHPEHDRVVSYIASITEQETIVDYSEG